MKLSAITKLTSMVKFNELASRHGLPRFGLRREISRLGRHWDCLAVLLLVLASMPSVWFSPRTLVVGAFSNPNDFVDLSWILDAAFKASRGLWFGRDVVFTYGPLFQWLSSAPARWTSLSMGVIFATWQTLPFWGSFLCAYLALRLLLPEQPNWKRFFLLLLLFAVFWSRSDWRSPLVIFLFALFLRGWYAVQGKRLRPVLLGCTAALSCAVAFLYSPDTGVYAGAALLVSLAGVAWETRREPHQWRQYTLALVAFAGLASAIVLTVNVWMSRLLDFRYWQTSLGMIHYYRWATPENMAKSDTIRLLATLIACVLVFLLRTVIKQNRSTVAARTGFLLAGFVFALMVTQSALVRPRDRIAMAMFPMVFFASAIAASFRYRVTSAVVAFAAVGSSILFAGPGSLLRPSNIAVRYGHLKPLTDCPAGLSEFDHVCLPVASVKVFQTITNYLQQHSRENDSIVVFPYQTFFGLASHRNVAGGVMQSYLAGGRGFSRVDIAGLEKAAAPAGLYFPDDSMSVTRPHNPFYFTWCPEVWFWIFRHYRSDEQLPSGAVGLQRDDSRVERISLRPIPLSVAARSYAIRTRGAVVNLGDPSWPVRGGDFLRLRLVVHYSFWWKLRKPALLLLAIERADSTRDLKPFFVEPNVSSEAWFYPWSEADLGSYFRADESLWRAGPRPAITHLRLLVGPMDWVSIQPNSIEVESADAVKVRMAP